MTRTFANPDALRLDVGRPVADRALSGAAFAIDRLACSRAADVLRRQTAISTHEAKLASVQQDLSFRISRAAICHSINWDFLSERLAEAFADPDLTSDRLTNVTANEVADWLGGYQKPERIRAAERASILRDLGRVVTARFGGDPIAILEASSGRLFGRGGLFDQLDSIPAFREDPLRKKSSVLANDLVRNGIASFGDQDKIGPAIDYHIMRLYLRTGRVVPLHRATVDLLSRDSTPPPRLVKLLREAVSEALSLTAFAASLSIPAVNDLEWQLGRSICERAEPKCDTGASMGCPNREYCLAYSQPTWRSLREPDLKKRFY